MQYKVDSCPTAFPEVFLFLELFQRIYPASVKQITVLTSVIEAIIELPYRKCIKTYCIDQSE